METSNNFNQNLIMASEGRVIQSRSVTHIVVSGIMLLGSILLFGGSQVLHSSETSLYMLLVTTSFVLGIASIFRLISGGKVCRFKPTGSPMISQKLYFGATDLQRVLDLVEHADYEKLETKVSGQSTGVRMDVSFSVDRAFAAVQLFEYVPHEFVVASKLYCLYGADAERVARLAEISKRVA